MYFNLLRGYYLCLFKEMLVNYNNFVFNIFVIICSVKHNY